MPLLLKTTDKHDAHTASSSTEEQQSTDLNDLAYALNTRPSQYEICFNVTMPTLPYAYQCFFDLTQYFWQNYNMIGLPDWRYSNIGSANWTWLFFNGTFSTVENGIIYGQWFEVAIAYSVFTDAIFRPDTGVGQSDDFSIDHSFLPNLYLDPRPNINTPIGEGPVLVSWTITQTNLTGATLTGNFIDTLIFDVDLTGATFNARFTGTTVEDTIAPYANFIQFSSTTYSGDVYGDGDDDDDPVTSSIILQAPYSRLSGSIMLDGSPVTASQSPVPGSGNFELDLSYLTAGSDAPAISVFNQALCSLRLEGADLGRGTLSIASGSNMHVYLHGAQMALARLEISNAIGTCDLSNTQLNNGFIANNTDTPIAVTLNLRQTTIGPSFDISNNQMRLQLGNTTLEGPVRHNTIISSTCNNMSPGNQSLISARQLGAAMRDVGFLAQMSNSKIALGSCTNLKPGCVGGELDTFRSQNKFVPPLCEGGVSRNFVIIGGVLLGSVVAATFIAVLALIHYYRQAKARTNQDIESIESETTPLILSVNHDEDANARQTGPMTHGM